MRSRPYGSGLQQSYVPGFEPFRAGFHFKGYLVALGNLVFQISDVHKDISLHIVRLDKAVAAFAVEEFDPAFLLQGAVALEIVQNLF